MAMTLVSHMMSSLILLKKKKAPLHEFETNFSGVL